MSKEEEEQEEEKREHLVLIQMLELYLGYAKKWEAAGNKSEIWTSEFLRTLVLAV